MTDDELLTSSLRCASTRPIDRFYSYFSSETPKNKLTVGIMDKPYLLPFDTQHLSPHPLLHQTEGKFVSTPFFLFFIMSFGFPPDYSC